MPDSLEQDLETLMDEAVSNAAPSGSAVRRASSNHIGGLARRSGQRGDSPTRRWETEAVAELTEASLLIDIVAEDAPDGVDLVSQTAALVAKVREEVGRWSTKPPDSAMAAIHVVAMVVDSEVAWGRQSDLLFARLVGLLFGSELAAHSCGVYHYEHGAWFP